MTNKHRIRNSLLVFILTALWLIGLIGAAQETNKPIIKVFSPLANLNLLLQQKQLPFELVSIPLSDNHPHKISALKISIDGSQERIKTSINYSLKFGWLRSIDYQIFIIDQPIKTKGELKFGNISEGTTYFSNNNGQNWLGWKTTVKKRAYFNTGQKALPPDLLADLQRIYDLAFRALLNQDDYSIHKIIHEIELDKFFQKYQLIDKNDTAIE